MIPYEDLVNALTQWRARNGLPIHQVDYLGEAQAHRIDTSSGIPDVETAAAGEEVLDMDEAGVEFAPATGDAAALGYEEAAHLLQGDEAGHEAGYEEAAVGEAEAFGHEAAYGDVAHEAHAEVYGEGYEAAPGAEPISFDDGEGLQDGEVIAFGPEAGSEPDPAFEPVATAPQWGAVNPEVAGESTTVGGTPPPPDEPVVSFTNLPTDPSGLALDEVHEAVPQEPVYDSIAAANEYAQETYADQAQAEVGYEQGAEVGYEQGAEVGYEQGAEADYQPADYGEAEQPVDYQQADYQQQGEYQQADYQHAGVDPAQHEGYEGADYGQGDYQQADPGAYQQDHGAAEGQPAPEGGANPEEGGDFVVQFHSPDEEGG